MQLRFILLFLFLFHAAQSLAAAPEEVSAESTGAINLLMEQAISKGVIAGGVVLVGDHSGTRFLHAYGRSSSLPDAGPVEVDTIFDLASLTKVVATTPSLLRLAEEGRLSLVDPVTKWLPEFAGKGKDEILLLHLLTHTSGLDDFSLDPANPRQSAVIRAAAEKLKGETGSRFRYADINFILLEEIITRVAGQPFDRFTTATFFDPLGMADTSFNPGSDKMTRCAATHLGENSWLVGVAQDYPARQLKGVAGHAGLFSTARDLGIFCRMLLNNGEFLGVRALSARAVQQMTAPYFSRGGKVLRGLGWDIASPYSSPRGSGFSETSFGHTGYSGSSLWIDPESDLFVILLTTRLEYRKSSEMNQLRSDLSTIAARIFRHRSQPDRRLPSSPLLLSEKY